MDIWWCKAHNSWIEWTWDDCVLRLEGREGNCLQVAMRLVSADALVVERENGEWPEWITDVDGPVWYQCGGTDDLLDDIYKAVNKRADAETPT